MPNGDFEQYSSLPTNVAQYANSIGWSNCNGSGSPDYFHINGSGYVQLPNSYFATVYPHGGSAVMGFIIWHYSGNFREYISHALSAPLTIGQFYNVSFYITNGVSNGNYGGFGVDQMSVAFTVNPLTQLASGVIYNAVPKYVTGSILYDTAWQHISFSFVADSAYSYITFGSFVDDSSTAIQQFEQTGFDAAYYFIDDISVANTTGIIENNENFNLTVYPNPFSNVLSIALDNNDVSEFILYDIASRKVLQRKFINAVSLNTGQLAKGIYLYEVRNKNGVIKKGKVVKPACR